MSDVLSNFTRHGPNQMKCNLCRTISRYENADKHASTFRNHMRTVHELNTEPNPNKQARITSFTVPVSVGQQFPNLPALDIQVIAACCSKHILPFDIVEDPVFSWAYLCAVSRSQSISDRVSELARNWRLKITEKIGRNFLKIIWNCNKLSAVF